MLSDQMLTPTTLVVWLNPSYMIVCTKPFFQYENHVDHHPIDQGTTEALSKHWMPLDEFTDLTMEGLQGGGFQNMVPTIKNVWDQVEKPKLEMIARAREMFSKK